MFTVSFSNVHGLEVISIEDDQVKVIPVAEDWRGGVETCPITKDGQGFMFGKLFVSFDECIKV